MQTATFTFADTQELKDHFDGKIERVEYGRYGNPTQRIAETKLAALEGAGDCLLFASGMAAMTTTLFAMLSRGTHVVVTDDSYRRTRQFLNQTLHRYGIECRRCRPATTRRSRTRSADDARARQRVADQPVQPRARPRALRPRSGAGIG
jgi:cystathionine gamma-synthase